MKKHLPFIITAGFHIIFGIAIIICAFLSFEKAHIVFGILLILSAVPHIFGFTRENLENKIFKYLFLINGIALVVLGVFCFFGTQFDFDIIFAIWGIMDIFHGLLEMAEGFSDIYLRKNNLGIITIVVGIIEIVFGVLLIIHLSNGVKLHMIVVGIILIFTAIKMSAISVVEYHQSKDKEKIE